MFGSKKRITAEAKAKAEQLGYDIARKMGELIDRYVDIVVRFAASGWLQQMAHRARDLDYEHPDDYDFVHSKFQILTDFMVQLDDIIVPLEQQALEFVKRDFAFVLDGERREFHLPVEDLIKQKFDAEKDRIAIAASYVLGLSETQLKESDLI